MVRFAQDCLGIAVSKFFSHSSKYAFVGPWFSGHPRHQRRRPVYLFLASSFDGEADGLMPKSFTLEELLASLMCRISAPNGAEPESNLVYGEVALDLRISRATSAGVEHILMARGLAMLMSLPRRPGPSDFSRAVPLKGLRSSS